MLWNIIINWEYCWWPICHKNPRWSKPDRKEKDKNLLEKQTEKKRQNAELTKKQNQYIANKKSSTKLTYHSKTRIDERIKLKEETIKSNIYKSLLNKRCQLEYSIKLDNYRLFSPIGTYILSNKLVLITALEPTKRWEKKSTLYKLVRKQQRAYILEKMWFNLDYHQKRKDRITNPSNTL